MLSPEKRLAFLSTLRRLLQMHLSHCKCWCCMNVSWTPVRGRGGERSTSETEAFPVMKRSAPAPPVSRGETRRVRHGGENLAHVFGIFNKLICSPKTVLQEVKAVWAEEAGFKKLERLAPVQLSAGNPLVGTSKHCLCEHPLQRRACSVRGPQREAQGQPHRGAHKPS